MVSGLLFGINAALNLALTLALARLLPASAYGVLAAWSAAALLTATTAFDWIRFAAMRFYTPASQRADPAVRSTLDLSFVCCVPVAAALVAALSGWGSLPEIDALAAASLLAFAIGNAATEYLAALARNLGKSRVYLRLIALRHVFVLGGALIVAATTHAPRPTLIALALAVWPAVIYGALALRDRAAMPFLARRTLAVSHLGYGVAVIASVTEAALLPRLVSREAEQALRQDPALSVGRDLRRLAGLMLLTTGLGAGLFWAASPLASALLLAADYRAGFLQIVGAALVCALLYALQTYVLRPVFQMKLRTAPLVHSAVLALAVDLAVLVITGGRSPESALLAQLLGLGAGAVLLLGRGLRTLSAFDMTYRAAFSSGATASAPLGASVPQR